MMKFTSSLSLGLVLSLATCFALTPAASAGLIKRNLGPVVIFNPPATYHDERTLYGRTVKLNDAAGTLLATWENSTPVGTPPYFPIYRSLDHGKTWKPYSKVQDTVNKWGLRYQPQLYQLQNTVGAYPKGTILCVGNSIPDDLLQYKLDVYASKDGGLTWTFVSSIARNTKSPVNNKSLPVYEPFLLEANGNLIAYYADQRDSKHNEKIVHQTTKNLLTWTAPVDDVAVLPSTSQVGSPGVAALAGGKSYIMTYQYGGAPEADFAVYYKLSADPLKFSAAKGQVLRTTDKAVPSLTPYVIWTPYSGGGKLVDGTIVVSSQDSSDLLINRAKGDPTKWTRVKAVNTPGSYGRGIAVGATPNSIDIIDAGQVGQGATNKVVFNSRTLPA